MNFERKSVTIPIDGTLDLHAFQPKEIRDLVPEYLDACHCEGVDLVRIIHGKGKGTLCRIVHAILKRRTDVVRYRLATDASGWGATDVLLSPNATERNTE